MHQYIDPIIYLVNKHGYDQTIVKLLVPGAIYTAVVLQNGNIGLCSGVNGVDH